MSEPLRASLGRDPGAPAAADARRRAAAGAGAATCRRACSPPRSWCRACCSLIAQGGLWVLGTVVVMVLLGAARVLRPDRGQGRAPDRGLRARRRRGAAGGRLHRQRVPRDGADDGDAARGDDRAAAAARQITEAMASISGTFFGVFYVGWLLLPRGRAARVPPRDRGATRARAAAARWRSCPRAGAFLLRLLPDRAWCCATPAPTSRAAPTASASSRRSISPSKTVEGAIGGAARAARSAALSMKAIFDVSGPTSRACSAGARDPASACSSRRRASSATWSSRCSSATRR